MEYIFLLITIVLVSAQNILAKQYNVKTKRPDALLLGFFSVLFALVFFLADAGIEYGFKLRFSWEIVPYSVGFAVTYSMAVIGGIYAVQLGSLAVSSLISSYSLLIPTFYGVLFLNEDLSWAGLALLCISIFLINKSSGKSTVHFTLKWVIALLLSFSGNGLCSTVQKMQQLAFKNADYDFKNEFMIIALAIAAVILFVAWIVAVRNSKPEKITLKNSFLFGAPRGIANGIVNLLMIILAGTLPATILYPTVSAGGIVLGFFVAMFVYKEKLSSPQLVGYGIGVVSVILLNL